MKITSPGLRELFGEYRNNPPGKWWHQKTGIEQAMINIGCHKKFVRMVFRKLEPMSTWWHQWPQIKDAILAAGGPDILVEKIFKELEGKL